MNLNGIINKLALFQKNYIAIVFDRDSKNSSQNQKYVAIYTDATLHTQNNMTFGR